MAIYTQLSPSALPGKPYSFSPKAAATPESGPHTGLFTALSVSALPGPIHSFTAKTAVSTTGPHTGLFTALSVMALPGMIHSFTAKTEAEIVTPVTPTTPPSIGGAGVTPRKRYDYWELQDYDPDTGKIGKNDDQDMWEITQMAIELGILN